jgi:hypothetical protein
MRLWNLLDIELVNLHKSKWLSRDKRSHVPIQMTPIGKSHLQPILAVLLPDC